MTCAKHLDKGIGNYQCPECGLKVFFADPHEFNVGDRVKIVDGCNDAFTVLEWEPEYNTYAVDLGDGQIGHFDGYDIERV